MEVPLDTEMLEKIVPYVGWTDIYIGSDNVTYCFHSDAPQGSLFSYETKVEIGGGKISLRTEVPSLVTIPRKKGEEKQHVNIINKSYVYVRFARRNSFSLDTKIYCYAIDQKEIDEGRLCIGDIINIRQLVRYDTSTKYRPDYDTTEIRVEGFSSEQIGWYEHDIKQILDYIVIKRTFDPFFFAQVFPILKTTVTAGEKEVRYYPDPSSLHWISYDSLAERYKMASAANTKKYTVSKEELNSLSLNSDYKISVDLGKIYTTDGKCLGEFINPLISTSFETANKENKTNIDGGNNTMNSMFSNLFNNVQFGKINTSEIKYSIGGIAFRDKAGKYFTYGDDNKATDVSGMTIDAPLFAVPVAAEQVNVNDVIYFKNEYVIVKAKTNEGLKVVNPKAGDIRTIIPEVNIFNFNYYTKIINPFESISGSANAANPFGNILPLLMFGDIAQDNDNDMIKFLAFSQMAGGGAGGVNFGNLGSILPLLLLSDKRGSNDTDPFLMMIMLSSLSGGQTPFASPVVNGFPFNAAPVENIKVEIGDNPGAEPKVTC